MSAKKKKNPKIDPVPGPLSFMPGNKINSHRYFNTDTNVMLQTPYEWQSSENFSFYDALLRTGRAYLAWGRPEMKKGILSCFRRFEMINFRGKYWYQASRAPNRYQEDDVSRDQISGAFYSLLLRGDKDECLELIKHTPFRISRRFFMSPDFWLWTKAIQGKKWVEILWHISSIITLPFMFLWNKFINTVLGYKEIDQRDYNPSEIVERHKKFNRIQKILDSSFYPSYATNHMCWYLECVGDSLLKRIVQKIILLQVEKGNYVERLLCGDKTVTQQEVDSYIPMTEYRWSTKLDGNATDPIRIPEPWNKDLIEKLEVNQIDKDVLIWLWEKKKTEWKKK